MSKLGHILCMFGLHRKHRDWKPGLPYCARGHS